MGDVHCMFIRLEHHDPFPECIYRRSPHCKHILVVTDPADILSRSFVADEFNKPGYTFESVIATDSDLYKKIKTFMSNYPKDAVVFMRNTAYI